eukprot:9666429-Ditylum_brightwellii.AAC.1
MCGATVLEEGDGNNIVGDNNADGAIAQNGRSLLSQNNNKQRKSTLNKKCFRAPVPFNNTFVALL